MECISSVSYSIGINGWPTEPFAAKRGLRQGDPISPFLFILAMDYFSRMLKGLSERPNFNYHPICQKMNLIQLGFADDLLLYCMGDLISVHMLYDCFQEFSQIYWSQIFVLPTKVIKLIEDTCRRFLWTEGVELTKRALLAWEKVCYPASAGGLNILDIAIWKRAAISKLLWNLCCKKDKLWVKWVHNYYIKGGQIC
ncbi:uncharacterized protein [Nicotiana sylvestris]|uniref:uncharacterized protein n=1 Tax=Nicotiana sylvestris TaxID=4096 RepID=UPI00388CA08E